MSKKDDLLKKLCRKPSPKNFTTRELDALMRLCDCEKFSGGRGSGIGFVHNKTLKILQLTSLILEMNCTNTRSKKRYNS